MTQTPNCGKRHSVNPSASLLLAAVCLCSLGFEGLAGEESPLPTDPTEDIRSSYLVDEWQIEDGLPGNSVISIAQTPDRYLWFGTFNGLARFDGVRFTIFDSVNCPAIRNNGIVKLLVDATGSLWVRTEPGQLLRLRDNQFEAFGVKDGLPPAADVLEKDDSGNVWVTGRDTEGWYQFDGGKFIHRIDGGSFPQRACRALVSDGQGSLWGLLSNNLVRVAPPDLQVLNSPDGPAAASFSGAGAARNGGMWVVSPEVLRAFRDHSWQESLPIPMRIRSPAVVQEDRRGGLWIGTWTEGLFHGRSKRGLRQFYLGAPRHHAPIRKIFEDAEGNLWFGTDGAGVFRLRPRAFQTFDVESGLGANIVKSVTADRQGNVWAATASGFVSRIDGEIRHRVEAEPAVGGRWCILCDSDGVIWSGGYGGPIFRFSHGQSEACTEDGKPSDLLCFGLFEGHDRAIWLGGSVGLYQIDGTKLLKQKLPGNAAVAGVGCMAEDSIGNLYAGLIRGGLWTRSPNGWKRIADETEIGDQTVSALFADREGIVWIGTSGHGLCRLDHDRLFRFDDPVLALPRYVTSIIEDQQGYLWLGSNTGVYRADRRELGLWVSGSRNAVSIRRYEKEDGLASNQTSSGVQPAVWRGPDGRLWFATVRGLSVVDPAQLPFNTLAPGVVIEEALIDGEAPGAAKTIRAGFKTGLRSFSAGELSVPAGSGRVELRYAGLSFTAPDRVRFRYKLDGLDHDWVDADTRRAAYFSHLPPGDYHFRVIACNNDGIWNNDGASLAVTVLPYYWQAGWFRLLLAASLGIAAFLAYHRRITGLEERRAAQQAFSRQLIESQDAERKRIASELHDSLGQNLLVIKNRALLGLSPGCGLSAGHLEEISKTASQALQEVREIAYHLRPYQLDRFGLTEAVKALVEQVSSSGPVRFSGRVDDIDKLFDPEDESHLFRIIQEAFNNILKHSGATTGRIQVIRDTNSIMVTISDNGRGFDPSRRPNSASLGLSNIAERAGILDGALQVTSSPGEGTILTLSVPIPHK